MTDPTTPEQPTPPPPPSPAAAAPAAPLTEAEDTQWASFAHFGGILGILPSLIIFLVFKDRGARTRVEAKEALNWQITVLGAIVVLFILNLVLAAIDFAIAIAGGPYGLLGGFGGLLYFAVWIANIVFSVLGGVRVNGGGSYRYPVAIRLVR